ncbi:uncharacterized protein ACHE_70252S [Aspergillus chevalieri]|uniref:Uncharacterized protein n=1 Tax=Aspergillus chevalieri TaxID=182096 RepID=A0A7R7VV70_ASPCH|nr:uncharacterized protein ACHE_70225A [Aspergillus chevalieri]XP_043139931.1 uncharacterized protein ACHE_70252S [Aspergillus chevalieri]BCR91382.1 hypothetical protein ACHE_70225A [Aspergillus chevalieri]BCR91409.1 hypothetical protein ACHE_70252S [Aspergillus chevalieri]
MADAEQDLHGKNQEPGKTRGFPLGKGHDVFDAEHLGAVRALQLAEKVGDQNQSLSCWTPKRPLQGCDTPSQGQVKH